MNGRYSVPVVSHLSKVIRSGRAEFGDDPTSMWMASLDTRTGAYPEDDRRPSHIPRRHYRAIDAPKGCSLYWDIPSLIAARNLAHGVREIADAAVLYVTSFIDKCRTSNGVFLWGNHYYWDAFEGCVKRFTGEETPVPVDLTTETGDLHETRPIPPPWELFYAVSAPATIVEVRQSSYNSLYDPVSGGFNRHADGRRSCAFLESGGILVLSLSWLAARTGDPEYAVQAGRIASFSFDHRSRDTGLLENNPTGNRWDKYTCTTEVGLWSGCLLQAARLLGSAFGSGFEGSTERVREAHAVAGQVKRMADEALSAYLRYGWDEEAGRYYGRLRVEDASPVLGHPVLEGDSDLSAKHQPGDYADPWRPLFPAHDYPYQCAESCLDLWIECGGERFRTAALRWAAMFERSLADAVDRGYAEHFGRCIHYLHRCGRLLERPDLIAATERTADLALESLYENDMFRTHPGEHRYDAVDGAGYLLLSLLTLATGEEPEMYGSRW